MSHWKQRKPRWAIHHFESGNLVSRGGLTCLHPSKRAAKEDALRLLPSSAYRLVKVWIKYEEVKS